MPPRRPKAQAQHRRHPIDGFRSLLRAYRAFDRPPGLGRLRTNAHTAAAGWNVAVIPKMPTAAPPSQARTITRTGVHRPVPPPRPVRSVAEACAKPPTQSARP